MKYLILEFLKNREFENKADESVKILRAVEFGS